MTKSLDHWIYVVNPREMHLDGGPATPARVLEAARKGKPLDWWLRKPYQLSSGTSLWYYFAAPDSAIAAVGTVQDIPYEESSDLEYPWRVDVLLDPVATEKLVQSPVLLSQLSFRTVQTLRTVDARDLPKLLQRAGL